MELWRYSPNGKKGDIEGLQSPDGSAGFGEDFVERINGVSTHDKMAR